MAAMIGGDDQRAMTDDATAVLSEREIAVLELVADGLTNREIAERLSISADTVKFRLSTAYRKLGVDNRGEAARALGQPGVGHNGAAARAASEHPTDGAAASAAAQPL